ncbi:unnamed protein product [Effrenium voratum]|uniref:Pentatricopeptide repeat-containing protein, chloroplastic n=1 Tax=Effrenium voratum TaxID=2562239 RepID=A0AA36IXY8_9DINO|nr:unnamed protein product [Effrenium voratum]
MEPPFVQQQLLKLGVSALQHGRVEDWQVEPLVDKLLDTPGLSVRDLQVLFRTTSSQRWSQALRLLQALRLRGRPPSAALGDVTLACEQAGQWQAALGLVESMRLHRLTSRLAETASGWRLREGAGESGQSLSSKLPDRNQREALELRLRSGRRAEVSLAAAAMRRFGTPRPRDYTLVMTAYGRVDMWEEAVALLDEMRSCAYDPGVINFNCALAACERAGAWQAAMTILDGMKGSQICPDQLSFMAVLGAVSQQSFWQHGLQLLTDMESSSEAPDAMAYSAAMGACGRSKRWWVAVALLGKVKSSELIPDEVMYNTVISACEQSRRWQQALALLREVAPSKSAHEASQPQPEVDFLGMTAQDWAPLEEELQLKVAEEEQEDEGVEEAWQAFRKTYQLADLPKQEKRDGWDAAEQVLRGFEGIDQQILNVYIFSSTISACAKGQQVDLALELLDEMVYYKLRVSAIPLSAIASGCADVGRWQLALQLLGRSLPDVPLFNSVMWAVGKAHRWQQALLGAAAAACTDGSCEKGKPGVLLMQTKPGNLQKASSAGRQVDLTTVIDEIQSLKQEMTSMMTSVESKASCCCNRTGSSGSGTKVFEPGLCAIFGDPHFITFDGAQTTVVGDMVQWLVKSDSVYMQALARGSEGRMEGFAVGGPFLYGHTLVISKEPNGEAISVAYDGKDILQGAVDEFHVPNVLHAFRRQTWDSSVFDERILSLRTNMRFAVGEFDGRFQGELPPSGLMLFRLPKGIDVTISGVDYMSVVVSMAQEVTGQSGYCGNFNGDPDDDAEPVVPSWDRPIGDNLEPVPEAAWLFPSETVLLTLGDALKVHKTEAEEQAARLKRIEECPGVLLTKAEAACNHLTAAYHKFCVFDVCLTKDMAAAKSSGAAAVIQHKVNARGVPMFMGHGRCLDKDGNTFTGHLTKLRSDTACQQLLRTLALTDGVMGAQLKRGGVCEAAGRSQERRHLGMPLINPPG